jgi:hypothetical protein
VSSAAAAAVSAAGAGAGGGAAAAAAAAVLCSVEPQVLLLVQRSVLWSLRGSVPAVDWLRDCVCCCVCVALGTCDDPA